MSPSRLATSTTGCSPSIPTGSIPDRCGGAPLPQKAQLERSLTHRRVFANLVKPSPLSIILANAAPFLKSNYGDELVRSPRMTGTIAEESMCQER